MAKVYCVETKQYIEQDNVRQYQITGKTEKVGNIRCAVLKRDSDGKTYLKPWDQIANLRRPGENNISAKLKTAQVREIVKEAYTNPKSEVTFVSLAEKYGVQPETISNIVHGRAWRHVTRGLIQQLVNGNKAVLENCVSASNDMKRKNTKLNPSMAKFIVRDYIINKIPIPKLADKYLLSISAIRRVVTGKSWKATTLPAIDEFSKWVK